MTKYSELPEEEKKRQNRIARFWYWENRDRVLAKRKQEFANLTQAEIDLINEKRRIRRSLKALERHKCFFASLGECKGRIIPHHVHVLELTELGYYPNANRRRYKYVRKPKGLFHGVELSETIRLCSRHNTLYHGIYRRMSKGDPLTLYYFFVALKSIPPFPKYNIKKIEVEKNAEKT